MRSLLPLFLLLSVALASPKCPDGVGQDDTFDDGTYSYTCVDGKGSPQGCMTKDGEIVAFGDHVVHSENHNGELLLHCKKNNNQTHISYGVHFKFRAKPDDQLKCADGRKAGEEYIHKESFYYRCVVNKETGHDGGQLIGCADSKGNKVAIGEKSIESRNANGVLELRCTSKDMRIQAQRQFVLNPADQLRCSNGKKIGEEFVETEKNRFVYRCNVSDYGEDYSDVVGCLATDNVTTIYIGQKKPIGGFLEICVQEGITTSFRQENLPQTPCIVNGKEYKQYANFIVEDKFKYRCEPVENSLEAKAKFIHCVMPNGVGVGLGRPAKYNGKTYTCKSQTELIVE